jgi:hypothetical protein
MVGGIISAAMGDSAITPGDVPPPWLHPDQVIRGGISGIVAMSSTDQSDSPVNSSHLGPVRWTDYPYNPPGELGLIKPDLAAPGVNINSTAMGGGYSFGWSGTAFATPHAAGAFALLLSYDPNFSPAELDSFLEITALDIADPGKDNFSGAGRIDLCSLIVELGVEESGIDYRSSNFVLFQNSPNPFHKLTAISFQIPNFHPASRISHPVSLNIYDISGRHIRTLVDQHMEAGFHSVTWEGKDDQKQEVSSGIYFYKLSMNGKTFTRNLIYLK